MGNARNKCVCNVISVSNREESEQQQLGTYLLAYGSTTTLGNLKLSSITVLLLVVNVEES